METADRKVLEEGLRLLQSVIRQRINAALEYEDHEFPDAAVVARREADLLTQIGTFVQMELGIPADMEHHVRCHVKYGNVRCEKPAGHVGMHLGIFSDFEAVRDSLVADDATPQGPASARKGATAEAAAVQSPAKNDTITLTVTLREVATILAGLRSLQTTGVKNYSSYILDIATDLGKYKPMSAQEIDDLCERINLG